MFRIWDNKLRKWWNGNYGGSKQNGKVFSKLHSAKESIKCVVVGSFYNNPIEYPVHGTRENQDKWRVLHWEAMRKALLQWNESKHLPIEELSKGRFSVVELKE